MVHIAQKGTYSSGYSELLPAATYDLRLAFTLDYNNLLRLLRGGTSLCIIGFYTVPTTREFIKLYTWLEDPIRYEGMFSIAWHINPAELQAL